MAKLRRRKDGTYFADLRDVGKGRQSLKTKNERVARKRFNQLQLAVSEPRLDPLFTGQVLTLALEATKLRAVAQRRDVPKALENAKDRCKPLDRHLGEIDFNDPDLSLERVGGDYLINRTKDLTNKGTPVTAHTALKDLKKLSQGLKLARKYRLFDGEPSEVKPDGLTDGAVYKPADRWLRADEFNAVLREAPKMRRKELTLAVETGADHGELEKVHKRRDVDLSTVRGPHGAFRLPGTKTDERDRWIPLSQAARAAVDECLGEPGEYLVPKWDNYKRDLKNPCKRAGVEPFVWKDLRRTFASRCAQAGVPEFWTVKLMGHADSKMIRRVYARLSPATYAEAIKRLEAVPYTRHATVIDFGKARENLGTQKDEKCKNA